MKRNKYILVVSDNEPILRELATFISCDPDLTQGRFFDYACHPNNHELDGKTIAGNTIVALDIKKHYQSVIDKYDLVISAHCKQIFPTELVEACNCINIHPGYNPYNRGWYPQVFSILNSEPLGATIHEIDAEIDHGKIIDHELVPLNKSDTSLTAYNRVRQAEFRLIRKNLKNIVSGSYTAFVPDSEGNVNLKKDFSNLLELPLDKKMTLGKTIDLLRALTHPPYKNAYFINPESGKKIWVSINLEEE